MAVLRRQRAKTGGTGEETQIWYRRILRYASARTFSMVLIASALATYVSTANPQSTGGVSGVGCPAISVSSLDRSIAFYRDILTFSESSRQEVSGDAFDHLVGVFGARARVARMTLGDECVDFVEYLTPMGNSIPLDAASNDQSFQHLALVVNDMSKAYAVLRAHHVQSISAEPQTLPASNRDSAGIGAFYFKDNDGHVLELISFPADKGRPKWHFASSRLFLGIDHTAIVVFDTNRSLAFYHDLLGLDVVGTSDNSGREQERLSGVFNAHLRITSLRAKQGPGVELLEYLTPGTGEPISAKTRANDLQHWQVPLMVLDLGRTEKTLETQHGTMISSGAIDLRSAGLGQGSALLIKDPDGHVLELIQP